MTTLAGSAGNPGSADGTNSAARFNRPAGVAVLHLCWSAVHGLSLLLRDGALGVPAASAARHARAVIGRLVQGLERGGAPF